MRPNTRMPATLLAVVLCSSILALLYLISLGSGSSETVADEEDAVESGQQQAPEWTHPTAEDLEKVEWVAQPCVHFLDHLRRTLEEEPRLATEEEALQLENTGPDTNARILSALGRLPANDEEVDWDATFNRFIGAQPTRINPLFSTTRYEFWVESLVFVGPIAFDWDFEFFGDLDVIEKWETSKDHLMDRVVFRKDLLWSDGTPFTAHDVEFTWRLLSDPGIPALSRKSFVDGLRGVKAYDDHTVVYFQNDALATNRLHIAWGPIPKHVFEKELADYPTLLDSPRNRDPVTCGPYRLIRWEADEELVFERNTSWYRGHDGKQIRSKPYFQKVRLRVLPANSTRFDTFLTGGVDDCQLDSSQWVEEAVGREFYDGRLKVRGNDEWTYAFIGWNALSVPPNPFFGDRRVRRAMALTLDHDFLLKGLFQGIYRPGQGIFHPDSPWADTTLEPLHRDLDEAEKLLDQAGWQDSDGDGIRDKMVDGKRVPFRFTVSCPKAGSGPKVAEQLQADLKAIGVDCIVQLPDPSAFFSAVRQRKVQAYLLAMGTGVDPDTVRNLFHTGAIEDGRNETGYSNPEVDRLLDAGRRELDRDERRRIYARVDHLIHEDQPLTVLLYQPTLWAFSESLRGYRPSPKGFYGYSPGFHSIWKKR